MALDIEKECGRAPTTPLIGVNAHAP
jgi:hypothetical protein